MPEALFTSAVPRPAVSPLLFNVGWNLGFILREYIALIGAVQLPYISGEGLELVRWPLAEPFTKNLTAGVLDLMHFFFALGCQPDGLRTAIQGVRLLGDESDTFKKGDLAADGRFPDADAGGQLREPDGSLPPDDGQEPVRSWFHVGVNLPRELLRDRPGASPKQAELVFHGFQGRVDTVLGIPGRVVALNWVAHGNHSRVSQRERLYWCGSATFGGLWMTNSAPDTPAF
jgi:hypothetical protein